MKCPNCKSDELRPVLTKQGVEVDYCVIVVEYVYLLIDLFTILDTADVEAPVFLAISAMEHPF